MEQLIYLDNAATSWPKPDNVYKFMTDFYRACGVNPGRSGFDKAIEAGNILEDLRLRLTNLGNSKIADRADYAFGSYRYFVGQPLGAYLEISYQLGAL